MQKIIFPTLLSILLLAALPLMAQNPVAEQGDKSLPRGSLSERFSSQAVEAFFSALEERNLVLHSIMIVQNGKVTYEHWFGDNSPTRLQPIFSITKTWTGMAAGFAIQEGLFGIDDKVISFFPDVSPETVSENLAKVRIRDLLTMSTGHAFNQTMVWAQEEGGLSAEPWDKAFLAQPVEHEPGTVFVYQSLAPHMISTLIERLSGENIVDYLTPRLYEPLGITEARWNNNPAGKINAAFDSYAKTEDLAKLGQFLLQKGRWNGKQLLPEAWIEDATSFQVMSTFGVARPAAPQDRIQRPGDSECDYHQGYGYQIWRSRHNSFRAEGALGQFVIVLPEKNAVVVLTANIPNTDDVIKKFNLFWEHIFPAL